MFTFIGMEDTYVYSGVIVINNCRTFKSSQNTMSW